VKIFPCGTVGGAKYIKALKAPLPQIPMVPTGGVNLHTAADFILAGAVALGIGGELVSASALESGDTASIVEAAQEFVAIVRNARVQVSSPNNLQNK
jgi:2-dehydro-3-deoxyphosphogluconate aldolase / (4S)-4-hydroxy-2-oxoglutarate aldolase